MVEEPSDYTRWIRYPLKEKPVKMMNRLLPPSEEATEDEAREFFKLACTLAKDERIRSIEANVLAREKSRERVTLKDKLFEHLDNLNYGIPPNEEELLENNHPSHQTIWEQILNFYMTQGKPICFRTLNGYTTLYQLHAGAITPSQAYVISQNNN